jgi:superfamily II DNA or RNA helicase
MLISKPPLYVSGGAAYPRSKELQRLADVETRYGEAYSLARHNAVDDTLWFPRAMCPSPGPENDRRSSGVAVQYEHRFTPRNEEQARIAEEGYALLHAERSFVLQAPTGWGKTIVGCAILSRLRVRTLVITTKEDILKQWADAAKLVLGLSDAEIGFWRGDEQPQPQHTFVVGLVQSVMKGPERYPDVDYASFGLVVCDEVHRMGAEHFSQAMWWFPAKLRLGLSATPYRKDGREQVFFGHIGPIALTAEQETLVPRVIIRRSDWKVPRVRRYVPGVGEQYVRMPHEPGKLGHVSKMLSRHRPRNALIVRFLMSALAKKRNTVVFSDNLKHLDLIREQLLLHGLAESDIGYYVGITGATKARSASYDGKTRKERQAQRERAKVCPVVLATYQMASEATDVPWWDTCVLAIPRADVVQIVGRIRREYPGKGTPVVLDIVDDDSPVYEQFFRKRMRWYQSLGCEVRVKS